MISSVWMKLLQREEVAPAAAVEKAPGSALPEDRKALEAFGQVLREYGKHAYNIGSMDAPTANRLCELWAAHVQNGTPVRAQAGQHSALAPGERDWTGVRHFFTEHRCQERRFVSKSLSDLNQVVWTFIQGLRESLVDGNQADKQVQDHLDRLRAAVVGGSTDEIREQAMSTVASVSRIVKDRQERQQKQVQALYATIRDLGTQLEQARQENTIDSLTGLSNRRALDMGLARAADMFTVFGQRSCLLLVDADHFKTVNDTFGHSTGDVVLRRLSDCLTRTFPRKSDLIARYGGEEFAVIVHDTPMQVGKALADRLLMAVRGMVVEHEGKQVRLTVSVGISAIEAGDTAIAWFDRADRSLYEAKRQGRDRMHPE